MCCQNYDDVDNDSFSNIDQISQAWKSFSVTWERNWNAKMDMQSNDYGMVIAFIWRNFSGSFSAKRNMRNSQIILLITSPMRLLKRFNACNTYILGDILGFDLGHIIFYWLLASFARCSKQIDQVQIYNSEFNVFSFFLKCPSGGYSHFLNISSRSPMFNSAQLSGNNVI